MELFDPKEVWDLLQPSHGMVHIICRSYLRSVFRLCDIIGSVSHVASYFYIRDLSKRHFYFYYFYYY